MLNPTNRLPKYPTIDAEPEQLDLFGWSQSRESTITGYNICPIVCDQIAHAAGSRYSLSHEQNNRLRDIIVHQCSSEPAWSVWHDYVIGFAATMSFLPTPLRQTFSRSDRAALASDWACVQSDISQVWHAITTAEGNCNERSEQQRQPRRET